MGRRKQPLDYPDQLKKRSEELQDTLELLTDFERTYAQIRVLQGKKRADAIKLAGSNSKSEKNMTRMSYEIEARPHVAKYMDWLKEKQVLDTGITFQEVINNARLAIDMAIKNKKPRDIDSHNRLLAELGGFINKGGGGGGGSQTNVNISVGDSFKTTDDPLKSVENLKATLFNTKSLPKYQREAVIDVDLEDHEEELYEAYGEDEEED